MSQNDEKTFLPYVKIPDDECKMTSTAQRFIQPIAVPDCAVAPSSGGNSGAAAAMGVGVTIAIIVGVVFVLAVVLYVSTRARSRFVIWLGRLQAFSVPLGCLCCL